MSLDFETGKFKILKSDSLVNLDTIETYSPVQVYRTACLMSNGLSFLTVLSESRSALPGSVTVSRRHFSQESFKSHVFNASGAYIWSSLIQKTEPLELENKTVLTEHFAACANLNIAAEEFKFEADSGNFRKLLGKGAGLTPCGDDFLAGALNAAAAFSSDLFDEIYSDISGRLDKTTRLSSHYLGLALMRRGSEDIQSLIKSILTEDKAGTGYSSRRIKSYGDSSGEFMLEGFKWALQKILS